MHATCRSRQRAAWINSCVPGHPHPTELLTWDIPWARATHEVAIAVQVMEGQRPEEPPAGALPGGGFRDLAAYTALMRRCWAQEPRARPASFAEVLAALRRLEC